MKNTRWITKRLMKMTCRLHVGYEIVGYTQKMCLAVIPSILEAALAGVTPANNIGHRTKIAMDNLLRTLPTVLAKQACYAQQTYSIQPPRAARSRRCLRLSS
jgi:hypothetical protein